MMPVIRVNDSTFANLGTLRDWARTRTPSETIDYALKVTFDSLGMESENMLTELDEGETAKSLSSSLQFTKPIKAEVGGKKITNPKWSSILIAAVDRAAKSGLSDQLLVQALGIPAKIGKYEEQGFKHIPQLGISVQGQSAQDAWTETARLANRFGFKVYVDFLWRDNEKAAHPGRRSEVSAG